LGDGFPIDAGPVTVIVGWGLRDLGTREDRLDITILAGTNEEGGSVSTFVYDREKGIV
jgi:hypothetical protein